MGDELCAFCLGGNTEIPPLGTLKDARDFVHPCSTCTLVLHRKCLVEWFKSVPPKQISREYTSAAGSGAANSADSDENAENAENSFDFLLRLRWLSVFGQYSSENFATEYVHPMHTENPLENASSELFMAPCPQCKSKITFQIRLLRLLGWKVLLRKTVADTVKCSTILLGLTGAATGILTMGYVGLARSGVAIVDTLVPVSLISPIFYRNASFAKPRSLLALLNGLGAGIDPHFANNQIKFQHITLLPVMLYRMRYLLLFDCIFLSKPRALLTEWIGELLLCNYVSSLGNHTLVKQLYQNIAALLDNPAKNSFTFLKSGLLFKNIDWWNPSVMVALTIPARWAYDLVYRMTANRIYFDLNVSARPLSIANSLAPEQLSRLENFKSQLAGLEYSISQRLNHDALVSKKGPNSGFVRKVASLIYDRTFYKYVRLKVLYWYHKLKVCVQHDYSSTLLGRPAVFMGVTTFLWPFISAHLGKLIYGGFILKVPAFTDVDKDKLIFLSNFLGMAFVALLKDTVNLFFCYEGTRSLSELTVVNQRGSSPVPSQTPTDYTPSFPGAYEH